MTQLLLDSSAYIAFKNRHPEAIEILQQAELTFLCPIVLGELRLFLESSRVRVLVMDVETSERYAVIHVALKMAGTPVGINDVWIAASAMQHGLPVLTSDRDFHKIPQIIVRHFSALPT